MLLGELPILEGSARAYRGDLDAVRAEINMDAPRAQIAGPGCDAFLKTDDDMEVIDNLRHSQSCQGVDAGTLFVLASHLLTRGLGFVIVVGANEIWHVPVYAARFSGYSPLANKAEAQDLYSRLGTPKVYEANPRAVGWAVAQFTLLWADFSGPNWVRLSGDNSTRRADVSALLELDLPTTNPDARIIGGKYLGKTGILGQGPRAIWRPTAWGTENDAVTHNPHLRQVFKH
jgi:hypothetical protein